MEKRILKVKEAVSFLSKYGIRISEPALRRAIRKNQIKNTYMVNSADGVNIPLESLINYCIPKLPGYFEAYNLGLDVQREKFERNVITADSSIQSMMISGIGDYDYLYLVRNWYKGYKSLQVRVDYDNSILHVYDDFNFRGTSATNLISPDIITDIWGKIGMKVTNSLINETRVFIYSQFYNEYSNIAEYSNDGDEFGFKKITDETKYEPYFKKLIDTRGAS